MKLNEIRTFVTVADTQSVQEAGNRLGLTQSAVSRLIQRLEAELGVTLFDRQTKPLALTRDGEVALAHARRILGATLDFTDAFAGSAEPRGTLRLGVAHVLIALTAGRPLDALRAGFPALTVRLQSDWSNPLLEQVAAGALDGALVLTGEGQELPVDLPARCLSVEPVNLIAAKSCADRPDLAAMNARGWMLQPAGCKYRNALGEALAPLGLRPNVTVESYDQTLLVSLVARGAGFGLAPMRLIAPIRNTASVRPVPVPGFALSVAVWLVRSRNVGRIGLAFDWLEDALLQQLTGQTAGQTPILHSAAE